MGGWQLKTTNQTVCSVKHESMLIDRNELESTVNTKIPKNKTYLTTLFDYFYNIYWNPSLKLYANYNTNL